MRVDELKNRFGDQIAVEWKAYLLRPESKPRSQDRFVAYTQSWLRPAELEPRAVFQPWSTSNPAPTGSLPAHVAAKAVASCAPESAMDFHHRLLTAYFTENRTISEWSVLADLSEEVGVGRKRFVAFVDEHQQGLTQGVIDDHNEAIEGGVTGVPTISFNEMFPIPGAQDVDTYDHWISRIIDRRSAEA